MEDNGPGALEILLLFGILVPFVAFASAAVQAWPPPPALTFAMMLLFFFSLFLQSSPAYKGAVRRSVAGLQGWASMAGHAATSGPGLTPPQSRPRAALAEEGRTPEDVALRLRAVSGRAEAERLKVAGG